MDVPKFKQMYDPSKALNFLLVLYKLDLLQVDDDPEE